MKILLVGGTGTISTFVCKQALALGMDVTVLNRGNKVVPEGVRQIVADIRDEKSVSSALKDAFFDVVAAFITFTPEQAAQDIRLFEGRCKQFIFISSATVYQKPPRTLFVTEGTPLNNPYWRYAQQKITCENLFMDAYRQTGFPVTIIRPSYTYSDELLPFVFNSHVSSFTLLKRMLDGKQIVIPGDGNVFWTITHASDFAYAFVRLMGMHQAIGQAFHITGDERHTWNEYTEIIADALGVKAHIMHVSTDTLIKFFPDEAGGLLGDKAQTAVFDNSKVKTFVPSFVCHVPFEVGVRGCIQYYQTHPEACIVDDEWNERLDDMIRKILALKP